VRTSRRQAAVRHPILCSVKTVLSSGDAGPQPVLGELARFILVGGTGFVIDGGILSFLLGLQWPVALARLISFTVAVAWTYALNRKLTFRARRASGLVEQRTALGYGVIQVLGALTNFGVFLLVVAWRPGWKSFPWLPLAIGAVFGLAVNYSLSRLLFQWRKKREIHE
jgi:putative flippase GtrA